MKKIISILMIVLLIVSMGTLTVQASTANMDLKVSSDSVKPGDTFNVALSITCQDGINGVVGVEFSYDTDKLELTSSKVSSNFSNLLGADTKADLIVIGSGDITSDDVLVWNFKVKDSIKEETTAIVSIKDFTVDSNASSNSEVKITGQSKTITIKPEKTQEESKEENKEQTKEENKEQTKEENKEETKEENKEQTKEETKEETKEQTKEEAKEENKEQTKETSKESTQKQTGTSNAPTTQTSTSGAKSEDKSNDKTVYTTTDTTKKATLPKTGNNKVLVFGLIILSISSLIVAYKKYSNYRDIK